MTRNAQAQYAVDSDLEGLEPWQRELLAYNPDYTNWGPHEDYMIGTGTGAQGWSDSFLFASWADFGPWQLDRLNECVNFYFECEPGVTKLVLWWLHPRKGCSRGLEITIQQADLRSVFAFLKKAAERNAERFSRVP